VHYFSLLHFGRAGAKCSILLLINPKNKERPMNEFVFEQAPLRLPTRWQVGDKVKLLTFPVGQESASYQLDVTISEINDGEYQGVIIRIAPLGRVDASIRSHFKLEGIVEFRSENIQGSAD